MILSLGYEAFSQQVLATEMQSRLNNTLVAPPESVLPSIKEYAGQYVPSAGTDQIEDKDKSVLAGGAPPSSFRPTAAVQAAVLATNFDSIIVSRLPTGTCPTSNCNWPTTPTLGICSKCNDAWNQTRSNLTVAPNGRLRASIMGLAQ